MGIAVGVIGYFTERWLLAVIAALVILLVVFLVLLVRMLANRERDDRLDRGLEGAEQADGPGLAGRLLPRGAGAGPWGIRHPPRQPRARRYLRR